MRYLPIVVMVAGCGAADFELTLLRAEARDGSPVVAVVRQQDEEHVLRVGQSAPIDRGLVTMQLATRPAVVCGQEITGPGQWSCYDEGGLGVADIR